MRDLAGGLRDHPCRVMRYPPAALDHTRRQETAADDGDARIGLGSDQRPGTMTAGEQARRHDRKRGSDASQIPAG
jgi:hypothetical protein